MDTQMHAPLPETAESGPSTPAASAPDPVRRAADSATRRVAPLWPLQHFVAVNPYLGLADRSFAAADGILAQVAGSRLTMPRSFYAQAIRSGRIAEADLAAALAGAEAGGALPGDVASLTALAQETPTARRTPLPTVADAAAEATGTDWPAIVSDRVTAWAGAYFDAGQARWPAPQRALSPFAAWRAQARADRTPEILGLSGIRDAVAALPATAEAAIPHCVARLGVPAAGLERYFHRLLMTVGGWAAYARYLAWQRELAGGTDAAPLELLAVRLAWEAAILEAAGPDAAVAQRWQAARGRPAAAQTEEDTATAEAAAVDRVLHAAYERGFQRELIARFAGAPKPPADARPAVQAAFCIDVRSEVFRRALEAAGEAVETIGFAGFFGVPIEVVPLGARAGAACCPVLLRPQFTVAETVAGGGPGATEAAAHGRDLRRAGGKAWKDFKLAAVSAFAFVETAGVGYALKLVTDSLGRSRPVPDPQAEGLSAGTRARLAPQLDPGGPAGAGGIPQAARIDTAEQILRGLGLTRDLAHLVLLVGHAASSVNNPHASGLDCGACGGHGGTANARVAAAILNDPAVRAALPARGLEVPAETVFVPALHDTTTDAVTLYDTDGVPDSHADDLARLRGWLAEAGRRTRAERAASLDLAPGADPQRAVAARSRDWSQVRPEWGLAGCAAFVAAPRARTRTLDLGGRAFLHSYDWRRDPGYATLELIMTAPMVVASWIALQYYGSTVDNRTFGSGNKVLHNVVGGLGVLEGNAGDLRVGLPWQSLHDGTRLVHEPLRLSVLIEAPVAAIDGVIARHAGVRDLVDNGWLHLFQIGADGQVARRYLGAGAWAPVTDGAEAAAA